VNWLANGGEVRKLSPHGFAGRRPPDRSATVDRASTKSDKKRSPGRVFYQIFDRVRPEWGDGNHYLRKKKRNDARGVGKALRKRTEPLERVMPKGHH